MMRLIVVLILGIGLGAAIGLLSAQQSGSESRSAIKGRYQEWRTKANGEESEEL
jgi:gas vesicle protein